MTDHEEMKVTFQRLIEQDFYRTIGGQHSTEEAFALPTQPSRVRFSAPLCEWTANKKTLRSNQKKILLSKKIIWKVYCTSSKRKVLLSRSFSSWKVGLVRGKKNCRTRERGERGGENGRGGIEREVSQS